MRPLKKWDLIAAQELLDRGTSQAETARLCGVSATDVHRAIGRGVLVFPPRERVRVVLATPPIVQPVATQTHALLDTRGDHASLLEWRAKYGRKTPRAYTMQEVRALYQEVANG